MEKWEKSKSVNITEKSEALFTKEQLLRSERFRGKRDVLNAVLRDNEKYSVERAEQEIEKFLKGRVK